jgi:pimeloyl-ACP methyl ester carboxylesterase
MATALNGSCEIYYESFGDPSNPTLLLVNGLGSQCINYHEDWCNMFVGSGLRVVRFDNRDVGLSSKFDMAPVGANGEAYANSDMAADAVAVLDAIGVERAHVMGLSMGGMIVQVMAIEHPDRLLSMTSVMSHTGERGYGQPTPEAFARLTAPPPVDRESFISGHIEGQHIWGSPAFADEARWRADAERAFDRCFHPSGTGRQYRAVLASPPRADRLPDVTTPTLVMHGDRDTLIDISGGRRTAELMPGSQFEVIEGMGHDYPPQLWDRWVELVTSFVATTTTNRR